MPRLFYLFLFCLPVLLQAASLDWGFFAHRRINRLAVFTLPPELIVFYKKHLEYITEHAVDPDKRRYATRYEAPRHYIDIDHWGAYPFEQVPRRWTDALMRYASVGIVDSRGDTTFIIDSTMLRVADDTLAFTNAGNSVPQFVKGWGIRQYRRLFRNQILPQYYEEQWRVNCDSLQLFLGSGQDCRTAFVVDHFSEYGIVPYHLLRMQRQLTEAFRQRSPARILRLSAEIGHYIADAHVPLHTSENYDGQLTGQDGIHAFWESRIPELFADAEFDFFVGKAVYIQRPADYFWDIVLSSHLLVAPLLEAERELRRNFPRDQQFCFEERLGQTVRTQCPAYARAYMEQLNGQVEDRMRASILAVGSAWYTAWVDAGQPDMREMAGLPLPEEKSEKLPAVPAGGNGRKRTHH